MNHHIPSIRTNILTFGALLLLLFATVGAAHLPLGGMHFPIAMTIAILKALLIALWFMHLLHSHRTMAVVAIASLFWLGIMIALSLGDYWSRGWLDIPGK
jgi:cytochrome c oxidase subunit 4